jgi:DNA-binding NarL/FixJ family response regulator
MRSKDRDPRVVIFERAAKRLGLSGRLRTVAWHYFLGTPLKQICRTLEMPEGTLRTILHRLHGRLRTSNRPEFVHGIYGNGAHGRRRTDDGRAHQAPPP